jgi:hypothetical protein
MHLIRTEVSNTSSFLQSASLNQLQNLAADDFVLSTLFFSFFFSIKLLLFIQSEALNTLFRGEDIASRVLRVYTRKTGTKYAFKILNHLIKEVSDNNIFLEIDPNRATPAMNLKQNFMQLETLAQRFFDSVVNSLQWVPPEFIKLCAFMAYESKKRFEDSEDVVVAGFLFLRFLCPAISSPEGFGLAAVGTPEARRTLLLVGKIMQNLANGVKFKEDFLTDMNRFLDKNEIACKEFFRKMRVRIKKRHCQAS